MPVTLQHGTWHWWQVGRCSVLWARPPGDDFSTQHKPTRKHTHTHTTPLPNITKCCRCDWHGSHAIFHETKSARRETPLSRNADRLGATSKVQVLLVLLRTVTKTFLKTLGLAGVEGGRGTSLLTLLDSFIQKGEVMESAKSSFMNVFPHFGSLMDCKWVQMRSAALAVWDESNETCLEDLITGQGTTWRSWSNITIWQVPEKIKNHCWQSDVNSAKLRVVAKLTFLSFLVPPMAKSWAWNWSNGTTQAKAFLTQGKVLSKTIAQSERKKEHEHNWEHTEDYLILSDYIENMNCQKILTTTYRDIVCYIYIL